MRPSWHPNGHAIYSFGNSILLPAAGVLYFPDQRLPCTGPVVLVPEYPLRANLAGFAWPYGC